MAGISDRIEKIAQFLFETRLQGRDSQQAKVFERWPDITPEERAAAHALYRRMDWDDQERELVKLTRQCQELTAKGIQVNSMDDLWTDYWQRRGADEAIPKEQPN